MEKRNVTADTIVGLFVLAGLFAFVLITFVIRQDLFGSTLTLRATFQSVSGLEYGSPVLVSGIRNGRVSSIRYVEADPGDVLPDGQVAQPVIVTMVVSDDVPIYTNARIRLVQQGFIGDKRVEIDPGSPNGGTRLKGDEPPLRGDAFFDMEAVFRKADAIVTDMQATVASFREFTTDDENIKAIRQTINNLNTSVTKMHDYLVANEDNVRVAIANVREVSEDMKAFSERAKVFVEEGGRADRIAADAEQTMAEFRRDADDLMNRINDAVSKVDARTERLTESATGMMDSSKVQVAELSENLQATSTNLNETIAAIRRGEGTVGRMMSDPQPFEDLKAAVAALHAFVVGEASGVETSIQYEIPAEGAAPK